MPPIPLPASSPFPDHILFSYRPPWLIVYRSLSTRFSFFEKSFIHAEAMTFPYSACAEALTFSHSAHAESLTFSHSACAEALTFLYSAHAGAVTFRILPTPEP
jgi:hypothetical protein